MTTYVSLFNPLEIIQQKVDSCLSINNLKYNYQIDTEYNGVFSLSSLFMYPFDEVYDYEHGFLGMSPCSPFTLLNIQPLKDIISKALNFEMVCYNKKGAIIYKETCPFELDEAVRKKCRVDLHEKFEKYD